MVVHLDNDVMFAKILNFAKEIPDSWLQSRTFKRHNKHRLIALENSIISCAKNQHNSNEKIERIAYKHKLEPKELLERIKIKKKLIKDSLSIEYGNSNRR